VFFSIFVLVLSFCEPLVFLLFATRAKSTCKGSSKGSFKGSGEDSSITVSARYRRLELLATIQKKRSERKPKENAEVVFT
jgi:hypothetical protein